ncbi:MAG: nitric oxide reductase activation protein NorD [Burkholderiales bacterium]
MSSPPPCSEAPRTAAALDADLSALLNPVLSARRTSRLLAEALAALPAAAQTLALHWTGVLCRTNHELAYQFAASAPAVLERLDARGTEAWVVHVLDTYDREGLAVGIAALHDAARFGTQGAGMVTLAEVKAVLELFLCGLSGRRLRLAETDPGDGWTDTDTLYLPPAMAQFATREQNFLAWKGLATHLWAQTRYGTFNVDAGAVLAAYADPARAATLFQLLEAIRLDAVIARLLPGLARELNALRGERPLPHPACAALLRPEATAADSLAVLATLYAELAPDYWFWMGALRLDRAARARTERIEHEKTALQQALGELAGALPPAPPEHAGDEATGQGEAPARFNVQKPAPDPGHPSRYRLQLGGAQVRPPEHVMRLLDSIEQDFGTIPDDYLTPAPDDYHPDRNYDGEPPADAAAHAPARGARIFRYDEWDCQRRHYRKHWCTLRETDVRAVDPDFVDLTLAKYAPQVRQLKRTFEQLRGEDKLLRAQPEGDDLDLDAVVAASIDLRTGAELSDRLMVKRKKAERDMAVMFMVDMSGSTKGWINDAEREALVLLCAALEVLGDRYAIYGFSGVTRQRCEIYRIKRFDEPYSDTVRGRIAGIKAQDYTRMGAAIRHLSSLLDRVEARTKLLITLSDGKPDDYSDHYRGEYGIEDTRQALHEAHRHGIHPFCITIDKEARDYLPHLYGAANWTLVDEIGRLPMKVAEIYRRLTT